MRLLDTLRSASARGSCCATSSARSPVAPRGLHTQRDFSFKRIGVGYDAAPGVARRARPGRAPLAVAAGAGLHLHGVVDDRLPDQVGCGWAKSGSAT